MLRLMPEFIADLQEGRDAHFARHVLRKTITVDGRFRDDPDDHRYHGVKDAWVRYVTRGHSAWRVIFLRRGDAVYLFRAGKHAVENQLSKPRESSIDGATEVASADEASAKLASGPTSSTVRVAERGLRLLRTVPYREIQQAILARRNLPHRDVCFVAPWVNPDLMWPTAPLGQLLVDQADDGASVTVITGVPPDQNIEWMTRLNECGVGVVVYPRLHSKLYAFILDERRRYQHGLPHADALKSLVLVGSANLTHRGLGFGSAPCNEEICYTVPEESIGDVESYVTGLMLDGYDFVEVRTRHARGQWKELEKTKW